MDESTTGNGGDRYGHTKKAALSKLGIKVTKKTALPILYVGIIL
jgi:hypothetical protein